jgi:hypothetical protein
LLGGGFNDHLFSYPSSSRLLFQLISGYKIPHGGMFYFVRYAPFDVAWCGSRQQALHCSAALAVCALVHHVHGQMASVCWWDQNFWLIYYTDLRGSSFIMYIHIYFYIMIWFTWSFLSCLSRYCPSVPYRFTVSTSLLLYNKQGFTNDRLVHQIEGSNCLFLRVVF